MVEVAILARDREESPMRTMSARDAKNHFGELLMEAQREPVRIEKNGRPVGVLYSWEEHEEIERLKLERLTVMIGEGLADVERGDVHEMTDELWSEIVAEARSSLDDESKLGS
jgi:prevent-host-death family protein